MDWLPRTFQSRISSANRPPLRVDLSEFLCEETICIFPKGAWKVEVVEELVQRFAPGSYEQALQAIWRNEYRGVLCIPPSVMILRARLDRPPHIRVALGICPSGVQDPDNAHGPTKIFVVFTGPTTQTRMHNAFLVSISALLHRPSAVNRLLNSKTPYEALQTLKSLERGDSSQLSPLRRLCHSIKNWFYIPE